MASRAINLEAFGAISKMGAIDIAFLDRVTFRDRVLARDVLVMFGRQAEGLLSIISTTEKQHVRNESAHKLKGSARGVGAFDVARAAEEVEIAQDATALANALAHLTVRVAEARLALASLIGNS
jgi:hypothetical protein